MKCPRCKEKMEKTNSSGIATSTCLYCNGTWININSFNKLISKEEKAPSKDSVFNSFKSQHNKSTNRDCPKCENENLYQIYIHEVELDLCSKCEGLFFDEGELKQILPTCHKSKYKHGLASDIAGEGVFWVLVGFFGSW